MSLKISFKTDEPLSGGQINWLTVLTHIPGTKQVFGNRVHEEDIALAEEAKRILREHGVEV
jgi:hypothetical protein